MTTLVQSDSSNLPDESRLDRVLRWLRQRIGVVRLTAVAGLILALFAAYVFTRPQSTDGPGLDLRFRYLLVTAEAPPDWIKQHKVFLSWDGRSVPLPVVFRAPGLSRIPLEAILTEQALRIGKVRVPVEVNPLTEFRVSNGGGLGILCEPSRRPDIVAFSLITCVEIHPPGQPGKVNPNLVASEMLAEGSDAAAQVSALVAAGQVIDVRADQ